MRLRLEAVVSGRVQGVGFRFFVQANAKLLGLKGFVQNLPDGNVGVVAEGQQKGLNDLIIALKKGPPLARVSKVTENFLPASRDFEDFRIVH